jgi:hypothetical protein
MDPPPTNGTNGNAAAQLPPEAIAFATRMYDAARNGQMDIFQQALPAGLPANMTNEKGDSLVSNFLNCGEPFLHVATGEGIYMYLHKRDLGSKIERGTFVS